MVKGTSPLTIYRPYTVAGGKSPVPVMSLGIPLIAFQESRGDMWDKYVAKNIDLSRGVAAVVGSNNNAILADLVYIIVDQGPAPTTFEIILSWSESDAEPPGGGGPILGTF